MLGSFQGIGRFFLVSFRIVRASLWVDGEHRDGGEVLFWLYGRGRGWIEDGRCF